MIDGDGLDMIDGVGGLEKETSVNMLTILFAS